MKPPPRNRRTRMRCAKYAKCRVVMPDCCYACAFRNGWPQDLGGDEGCSNFKPITPARPDEKDLPTVEDVQAVCVDGHWIGGPTAQAQRKEKSK